MYPYCINNVFTTAAIPQTYEAPLKQCYSWRKDLVQIEWGTETVLSVKMQKTKLAELYPPSLLLKNVRARRELNVMLTNIILQAHLWD